MKYHLMAIGCALSLCGCASKATSIEASYVSPMLYQQLDCGQLALQAQEVSARAKVASGLQDKKAGEDAALMAVGLVVFWPALLFTSGDGAQAAEVARLKGEMQAIETASRTNGCEISFTTT